jgi:hypothetical protein
MNLHMVNESCHDPEHNYRNSHYASIAILYIDICIISRPATSS